MFGKINENKGGKNPRDRIPFDTGNNTEKKISRSSYDASEKSNTDVKKIKKKKKKIKKYKKITSLL